MLLEVTSCRDVGRFVHDPMRAAGFAGFALTNRMLSDLKMPFEDDHVLVLFDGNLFNLDEMGLHDATYAEAAAHLYRAKGERFAAGLRGHFQIALLDKREQALRLYADPLGAKPLFHMRHNGALYFAAELKALMPVGPVPKRADPRALNNMVLAGYVLTYRTLVKEVSELQAGGMLHYDIRNGILRSDAYQPHSYQPVELSHGEHLERIAAATSTAFDRAFRHTVNHGRKLLIAVSGGSDSRAMAAFAAKNFGPPIFGITHRFHDDRETDLAERVCAALGIHQVRVPLDGGDTFMRAIDKAVIAGEAMTRFADTWRFTATSTGLNPEEFGTMHTGYPGCALYGAFARPEIMSGPEWNTCAPPDSPMFYDMMNRYAFFSHPQANKMFLEAVGDGSDRFAMLGEDFLEIAQTGWKGPEDRAMAGERIMVHCSQLRGATGAYRGIEEYMDFSAPFWDLDLVRAAMEMPAKIRMRGDIYYRFLKKRLFRGPLRHVSSIRTFSPLRKAMSVACFESKRKKCILRTALARFSKTRRRLYDCGYEQVVRDDASLRNFMADNLIALPSPEAFGIDGAKWRGVLESWRRDPVPYIQLTRHFFWLLFFKRWFDFWGKYVSI
jgi:hypothetical protein